MSTQYDYIVIGAGIIGLTITYQIKESEPDAQVLLIDKEELPAFHASSRNSGVLHAGFYYTADSLKAKFTVEGNAALKKFCKEHKLPLNECGKLVVAKDEEELKTLYELEKRGKKNGSNVKIIDIEEALEIEPNLVTHKKALHSPDTASVLPAAVCQKIYELLCEKEVTFLFQTKYLGRESNTIKTNKGDFSATKIINCAGLYADKIAQDFGFGHKYTMIPFKGLYLMYTKNKTDVRINIYPVPNLKNPFLGVHFTKTVTDTIKIGPTAIPALWRENYAGPMNFKLNEFLTIAAQELKLFTTNAFNFRDLAFEEIKKYHKKYFIGLAQKMVKEIDPKGFTQYTAPGIRAQLLDKDKLQLLQDFVVEGDKDSVHILNAVSPAFTCSFPFSKMIYENYIT